MVYTATLQGLSVKYFKLTSCDIDIKYYTILQPVADLMPLFNIQQQVESRGLKKEYPCCSLVALYSIV